jgi:intein/homing endonuclease
MNNNWNDTISSWQDQTSSIPSLVREHIIKSRLKPEEAASGMRSLSYDPLSVQYAMGFKDRKYSITYDVLKRIPHQVAVVSAILQTRCNQVAAFSVPYRSSKSVGYVIKHKDPSHLTTKSEQEFIKDLETYIYNCGYSEPNPYNNNKRDDFEGFLKKVVRDSLQYDQLTFEVVPDRRGKPYEFMAVDAATIRIAAANTPFGPNSSWHKRSANYSGSSLVAANADSRHPYRMLKLYEDNRTNKSVDYVQVINQQIENVYSREEMVFGVRNPRTDIYIQGYGYGELEQLVTIITAHLYAEEYNRRIFSQGSTPKGILSFKGDAMTPDMLEGFRRQWRANLEGVENSWKTPILQSEQGIDWIDLHPTNRDMEYSSWLEYLIKITCFTGNTPVTVAGGNQVPINSVEPGQLVYSHNGNLRNVSNVQRKKYSGKLLHIRAGEIIETTPEHPFYVSSSRFDHTNRERVFDEPEWKTADQLVEGIDYLLVPKKTYEYEGTTSSIDLSKYIKTDYIEVDGKIKPAKSNRAGWIPRNLPLTEGISKVLGLYASEGNSTNTGVYFTFSSEEEELQSSVIEEFKKLGIYAAPYSSKDTTKSVRVTSKLLAEAFGTLLGHKAEEKKVPQEISTAPRNVQKAFIDGVIAGDGSVPSFKSGAVTVTLSSVSNVLLEQLRHLLLQQDVYSRKYNDIKSSGFEGRVQYRLDINGTQAVKLSSWLQGIKGDLLRDRVASSTQIKSKVYESSSYFMVPISEIWSSEYEGIVYNLEVEGEHTYQVGRFAVHNCGVFLIDPAEINFDLKGGVQQTPLFESSQEWKLKASRDRGLKPLLRFIAKLVNEYIINELDDHFVFDFAGLEELTEQEKHTLRTEQVSSYLTLNEIRRTDDLPDLEYGDIPMNPTYLQAMQQKVAEEQQKAQMEQQKAQMEAQQASANKGAPQEGGGGQGEPQDTVNAPQYSDSFGKSLVITGGNKYLEIDLSELDSWKDSL